MKYKTLKDNFKSMDTCVIHPSSVKIGNLEKLGYAYTMVPWTEEMNLSNFYFFTTNHYEYYEPILGQRVLIELIPDSDVYVDLDQIKNNLDLYQIRFCIRKNRIILSRMTFGCTTGITRVVKSSLIPYFENCLDDTPISIKKLKKIIENDQLYV